MSDHHEHVVCSVEGKPTYVTRVSTEVDADGNTRAIRAEGAHSLIDHCDCGATRLRVVTRDRQESIWSDWAFSHDLTGGR